MRFLPCCYLFWSRALIRLTQSTRILNRMCKHSRYVVWEVVRNDDSQEAPSEQDSAGSFCRGAPLDSWAGFPASIRCQLAKPHFHGAVDRLWIAAGLEVIGILPKGQAAVNIFLAVH